MDINFAVGERVYCTCRYCSKYEELRPSGLVVAVDFGAHAAKIQWDTGGVETISLGRLQLIERPEGADPDGY